MLTHRLCRRIVVATAFFTSGALTQPTYGAAVRLAPEMAVIDNGQLTQPRPTSIPGLTCTAIGVQREAGGFQEPGTMSRSARSACHPHGDWTDANGYQWRLHKTGSGQLMGRVNYHGIPPCFAQIWPATGTFHGKKFEVTARNPAEDECAKWYGYKVVIQ